MSARIVSGWRAVLPRGRRPVVTIGVFDGVHRAHQRLIRTAVRLARRAAVPSIAITFHPDPQVVLQPHRFSPQLMPLEDRLRHLADLGLDWIWVIPFTRAFARLSAERFVERVLLGRLTASCLIVGDGFLFGRGRSGTMDTLRQAGKCAGMRVVAVGTIRRVGGPVSSSRIRALIGAGRLSDARQLLGRPPSLSGRVVRGAGRGHRLGVPTANFHPRGQVLPPPGVYAVRVRLARGSAPRGGVMNVGVRPTFGGGPLTCETHLPGFSGTLRGRHISVDLLARLRGERRFRSPAALIRQIRLDLARARRLTSSR